MTKLELLPHNLKMVDEISSLIDKGEHSIFYSEATGLGKSWIFMGLVEKYFKHKKVLYIYPKIAIYSELKENEDFKQFSDIIDGMTYHKFNSYCDIDSYELYDAIFIDEAHHLVSDIQGANILKYAEKIIQNGGYVFGMTATPEVKHDKKIIHVGSYFKNQVNGLDIIGAIENNIFPPIEYQIGINDAFDHDIKNMNLKTNVEYSDILIKNIVEKSKIKCWLLYFSNIADMENNKEYLKKLFPDFKILSLSSKNEDDNELILKEFNLYEGKVMLLSVSMLLEGIHIRKVGGVLLYRKTSSINVFLQILGRTCNTGRKESPIFIDVINSISNLKSISDNVRIIQDYTLTKRNKKSIKLFHVYNSKSISLLTTLKNLIVYEEYKGITYIKDNKASLAKALNISYSCIDCYFRRHPNNTFNDAIDYYLDKNQYEEYRGITYIKDNKASLVKALNASSTCIYSYFQNHPNNTFNDAIDYYLDKNQYEEYRGITYIKDNKASLVKALNIKYNCIGSYFYRHPNNTFNDAIDYYLSK